MATLADVRAKYPQYSDLSDEDLASRMHQKFYADMPREDFNQKIGYAPTPEVTTADTFADVGSQLVRKFNKGLAGTLALPYRGVDWVAEKVTGGEGLPNIETLPVWSTYLNQPEAKTTAGRYAGSVGETLGSSALPSASILSQAPRLAQLAPTTLSNAMKQSIAAPIAARPAAAVGADIVASTGAGLAQEKAKDAGFGPTGQLVSTVAGGMAPLAVGQTVGRGVQAIRSARASADPHARVAASLGDQSVDDLAGGIATGATNMDEAINRRTLGVLGEEMVASGGDRAAAIAATQNRLVNEFGVAPQTARDQLNRLASVHRDSDLFLGEYPSVAASNTATRRQQPQNIEDNVAGRIDQTGTQQLIDYVANSGSMASSQNVRNAIVRRADDLAASTQGIVQSMSPGQRTIQDVEAMTAALTRQARRDYDAVYNAPGGVAVNYGMLHGLLRRVVDRNVSRMHGRSGAQADALNEAIDSLYINVPAGQIQKARQPGMEDQVSAARRAVREARRNREPRDTVIALERQADDLAEQMRLNRREINPSTEPVLMPSLQQLQDMRGGIRGQITAARQAGETHIVNTLQPLYDDITRIMERSSPTWAVANRRWADMNLREVAADLGDAFARKAGPRFRQQMREFQRLAPEAQDVVRIHFTQRLLDSIEDAVRTGGTKNLGDLFASEHTRNMARQILGPEAAVQLVRMIRDANVASMSTRKLAGSPTHIRKQVQQEQDADLNLVSAADNFDWRSWKSALMEKAVSAWRERRNKVIGRVITTPMRDTPAVAEHLERMRRARARVEQYGRPRDRQLGIPGHVGGILEALENEEPMKLPKP